MRPYLQVIDENGDHVVIENIDEKLNKLFKNKLKNNYKKIITKK